MKELTELNIRKWEFQIFVIVGVALIASFYALSLAVQKTGALNKAALQEAVWSYKSGLEKTKSDFIGNGILGPWKVQGFNIPELNDLALSNSALINKYQAKAEENYNTAISAYGEMQAAFSLVDLSNTQLLDFLAYQFPGQLENNRLQELQLFVSQLPGMLILPSWEGSVEKMNASLLDIAESYGQLAARYRISDKNSFLNLFNEHVGDLQNALDSKENFVAKRERLQNIFAHSQELLSETILSENELAQNKADFARNFAHILIVVLVCGVFLLAKPKFFLTPYEWQKRELLLENLSRHEANVNHILTAADKTYNETQAEAHVLQEVLDISRKINRKLFRLEREYQYFKKEEVHDLGLVRQNMERLLHLGGVEVHKEDLAHIMKDFNNMESQFEKHSHRAERDVKDLDGLMSQFKGDLVQLESSVQQLIKSTYFLKRETTAMKDVEGIMRNG